LEDVDRTPHNSRKLLPNTAHHLNIDHALIRQAHMKALTAPHDDVYTQAMTLSVQLYESLRRDIEAEFEARKRELDDQRREAIRVLNEAWPKMGGSAEDLLSFKMEKTILARPAAPKPSAFGDGASEADGSSGRTVSMKAVRQEVDAVMLDERTDIITQTEIKDRILEKYPDAKVPSIRSAISHFLSALTKSGDLELIEKGSGGSPNRYRKTRRSTEALDLAP
jgi:hypothetical protein